MNANRIIKLVSVGLLLIGLVLTFFSANFYYAYCYTISPAITGYDCGNILTFPQLIAGVGIIVFSYIFYKKTEL